MSISARLNDIQKKAVAMGRNREAALAVILPRLMGAVLRYGHLKYDRDSIRGAFVASEAIDVWVQSHRHYVYLSVRYLRRIQVFSCRIYSDGGGDTLNQQISIIGWDRSVSNRGWQSVIFDRFDYDSGWLLNVPQEVIVPNVVRALNQYIEAHPQRHVQ
ncbi:hypothetical protein [Methylobacterium sp. J-070]|uniref:hypothetical protein n=1 Tax=Methylobacterium sp. J-070 TaxID=2836650 RepID=UPI001FB9C684|nr:hypothetical protein [Methylobacterium sp. J-070]MCJ2052933.1 hypothetical protein [Methylobacterium sp. J-070]